MYAKAHPKLSFVVATFLSTLIIHLIFIYQMLNAIPEKGLIDTNYEVVFFPQTILMYCLPPEMPDFNNPINRWQIAGKIIDAVPASLLYGAAIALVFVALKRICKKPA
jgi:hypothetical protein